MFIFKQVVVVVSKVARFDPWKVVREGGRVQVPAVLVVVASETARFDPWKVVPRRNHPATWAVVDLVVELRQQEACL